MNDNKVVLIRGGNSEWFEHAIFIMKAPAAVTSKDLVAEAERIINNYMCKETFENNKPLKAFGNDKAYPEQKQKTAEAQRIDTKAAASKRYIDYTAIIINICLILCSVLLGFLLNKIIS